MNIKPKECCELGAYEHVVPMPIDGRVRLIDYCISDIVLNKNNVTEDLMSYVVDVNHLTMLLNNLDDIS